MSKTLGSFKPAPTTPAMTADPAPARVSPPKKTRKTVKPGDGAVALSFKLNRQAWRDLKMLSAATEKPITDLVREGLALVAERNGMPLRLEEPVSGL